MNYNYYIIAVLVAVVMAGLLILARFKLKNKINLIYKNGGKNGRKEA